MSDLTEARKIINDVDKKMAELFEKRMDAACMVAEYKKEHAMPIDDFAREVQIIEKNSQLIENEDYRSYYVNFLKNNIEGFEHCRVLSTALQIGTRESRMIDGEYTLCAEDLLALTKFEDAIVAGNYDIDIHNPEGSGTSHHYFRPGEWYTIPYRCLIPRGVNNMLVAGRCISTTHEAQASVRIMPIVANIGEAAGVAIGVAAKSHADTRNVEVVQVQRILQMGV